MKVCFAVTCFIFMVNYSLHVVEGKLLVLSSGGVLGGKHDNNEKEWYLIKLSMFLYLLLGICNKEIT